MSAVRPLSDADVRVLTDFAAASLPMDEQRRYRFVSSFNDYRAAIGDLRAAGYIDEQHHITPAGRAALSGGEP